MKRKIKKTFSLSPEIIEAVNQTAEREQRSKSNAAETLLKEAVEAREKKKV